MRPALVLVLALAACDRGAAAQGHARVEVAASLADVTVDDTAPPVAPALVEHQDGDAVALASDASPNGEVTVSWILRTRRDQDIYVNRYTASGWGNPVLLDLDGAPTADPAVTACADGSVVVSWSQAGARRAARHDARGWGPVARAAALSCTAAAEPAHAAAIAWLQRGPGGTRRDVVGLAL